MNHSFDIDHAREYGLEEAVLIANFQFWIAKNRANGRHQREGRTWTYNSAKALSELLPYLSASQIRRTLDSLVAQGVLIKGNFNPSSYDRTLWFAFADESRFQIAPVQMTKSENGKAETGSSKTDIKPDDKPDGNQESKGAPSASDLAFEEAWTIYPKRAGGNSKAAALKAWNARVASGVAPQAMIEGVRRYAAFCKATGKENTEYVKQAASFFGPSLHFEEPWTPPDRRAGLDRRSQHTGFAEKTYTGTNPDEIDWANN